MLRVLIFIVSFGLTWTRKWKKGEKPFFFKTASKFCLCRPGKDFLKVIHRQELLAISSSQAVHSNCTTNHTLHFTVFFKLCSSNCSSFLCPVPRFPNSLLSLPNPVVSSLPITSSLPPVSIFSPFYKQSSPVCATCRIPGTRYFHFFPSLLLQDKPFTASVCYTWEEELGCGHRSVLSLH